MLLAMTPVKEGDEVSIRYRAVASDRRVLGATGDGTPLTIVAGGDDVLYGISHGIIGMCVGEKVVLKIDAEDAFGEAEAPIVRCIPRTRFPDDVQVGDALRLTCDGAEVLMWVVEEGAGDTWQLSSQHPFAGLDLEVHVQIVEA